MSGISLSRAASSIAYVLAGTSGTGVPSLLWHGRVEGRQFSSSWVSTMSPPILTANSASSATLDCRAWLKCMGLFLHFLGRPYPRSRSADIADHGLPTIGNVDIA